jgi:hypothetical protein
LEKSISEYCIPRSVEVEIDDAKTEDAKAKAPQTKASEASDTITNTKTKATRSIKVVEVLPRVRDGGAFVKYHSEEQDIRQVHSGIKKYLKENPVRFLWIPFCLPVKLFSYRPIKWLDHYIVKPVTVHPVLGKPLLEDMDRFPSTALKVEFVNSMEEGHPGKWDQEKIFSVFREYGKIADIIPQAAPGEDSDMPKSAVVWFRKIRSATAAKNCLQGYEIDYKGKTESLRVLYRRRLKVRVIRVWLFNQPKFTIPVLALLVASIVVWLFDPVRVWSIEAKITDSYTLQLTATAKQFWRFICRQVRGYMSPIFGMGNANQRRKDGNMGKQSSDEQGTDEQKTSKHVSELSDGNEIEVESLRRLLKGDRTTVVYHGPRPGQLGLILRDVVFDRKHILVIDCKPIAEASTGSAGAERLAKQVGYWPLFSFFSQLYGLLLGATIGSDGGAESAAETTLDEILRATRIAVKNVALREKDPKSLLSDDEYLHKCSPLKRPVVIFDNFSHNEDDRLIYEKLVDWYVS